MPHRIDDVCTYTFYEGTKIYEVLCVNSARKRCLVRRHPPLRHHSILLHFISIHKTHTNARVGIMDFWL